MDQEDIENLYSDKYEKILGVSFEDWQKTGPQTEEQAYARCIEIDRELNATYDEWFDAEGDKKEHLQDYRDKLKGEYDLLEEIFHLEPNDRNW
jgi:hypothetical protein